MTESSILLFMSLQKWDDLKTICEAYQHDSESYINNQYQFIDKDMAKMTKEEVQERIDDLEWVQKMVEEDLPQLAQVEYGEATWM